MLRMLKKSVVCWDILCRCAAVTHCNAVGAILVNAYFRALPSQLKVCNGKLLHFCSVLFCSFQFLVPVRCSSAVH